MRSDTAPPSHADTIVVDLNSRSATHVVNIVFLPVRQHDLPIIQFEVSDCLQACQQVRHWLQTTGPQDVRDLLRIENIDLNLIASHTKGNLFFLEGAATLEGLPYAPVSIFALQIPRHKHVRYFWTPLSPSLLLSDLASHELIGTPLVRAEQFEPITSPTGAALPPYHHTLYTIIAQCFGDLMRYPDSEAYIKATKISDVCPSILDPATAHQRIDAIDDLHSSHNTRDNGKDLGDDRYVLELHPAERELASLLYLSCAEYLLIKRNYFKSFSRETVLHAAKVRRAAANRQNVNQVAPLNGTEHIATTAEDEQDEADDADDDNDDDDPDDSDDTPADTIVVATPKPRATPVAARSGMRTRRADSQQNGNAVASLDGANDIDVPMRDAEFESNDDRQNDTLPTGTPKPRAKPVATRSSMRTRRAANQQNVNPTAPLAGTEQIDVISKDAEVEGDDNKQSDALSADTPKPKVIPPTTRSRMRTRQLNADLSSTESVNRSVPIAGTEQTDVTMRDAEVKVDDGKQSDSLPADTLNTQTVPPITRSRMRTRQSTAGLPVAQSVSRATPLAGTEQVKTKVEKEGDDDKVVDKSLALAATARATRSGARNTRRSAAEALATPTPIENEDEEGEGGDDNENDGLLVVEVADLRATARAARSGVRSARRSAAERLATPIKNEDDEDEDNNGNQGYAPPAVPPAAPPANPPTATRSGRRRTQMTGTELSASRSNAAYAGAKNRALRVRTQNKHIRTLEQEVAAFTYRRAYKMIIAWEALGFLDEERVLAVQEGKDDEGPSDGEWSE